MKKHVIDYWEQILRAEASPLESLNLFKCSFMSLTYIHPIWRTAGCSSSKVAMAVVQARMVLGRYRTEYLCRHRSKNKAGVCLLSENCNSTLEDLQHILAFCPTLQPTREKLMKYTVSYCKKVPYLSQLIISYLDPVNPLYCQFLTDCTPIHEIVSVKQEYEYDSLNHIFHITHTWCYALHCELMKLLGRWNIL